MEHSIGRYADIINLVYLWKIRMTNVSYHKQTECQSQIVRKNLENCDIPSL